jgi:hypothetical protein
LDNACLIKFLLELALETGDSALKASFISSGGVQRALSIIGDEMAKARFTVDSKAE